MASRRRSRHAALTVDVIVQLSAPTAYAAAVSALLLLLPPAVAVYALARDAAGEWPLVITIAPVDGILVAGFFKWWRARRRSGLISHDRIPREKRVP